MGLVREGLTTLNLYLYQEAKQNQIRIIVENNRTLEDIGITDNLNLAVQEILTAKGKEALKLRIKSKPVELNVKSESQIYFSHEISREYYFNISVKHSKPACDMLQNFVPPAELLTLCCNRRTIKGNQKYQTHKFVFFGC